MSTLSQDELVTIPELKRELKIRSSSTVWAWVNAGLLPKPQHLRQRAVWTRAQIDEARKRLITALDPAMESRPTKPEADGAGRPAAEAPNSAAEACRGCRYWKAVSSARNDIGYCRRMAPLPNGFPGASPVKVVHSVDWPATLSDDWCGEYAARSGLAARRSR